MANHLIEIFLSDILFYLVVIGWILFTITIIIILIIIFSVDFYNEKAEKIERNIFVKRSLAYWGNKYGVKRKFLESNEKYSNRIISKKNNSL